MQVFVYHCDAIRNCLKQTLLSLEGLTAVRESGLNVLLAIMQMHRTRCLTTRVILRR